MTGVFGARVGLVVIAAIVAIGGASGCSTSSLKTNDVAPPRLGATELVFGDTWVGVSRQLKLSVSNPNRSTLDVTASLSGGAPFSLQTETLTIASGDEATLTVTFAPEVEGPVDATLTARDQHVSVSGVGHVPPPCATSMPCREAYFSFDAGACAQRNAPERTNCHATAPCFASATCNDGECVGEGSSCHDGNECTLDVCTATGCSTIDQSGACPAPTNPCLAAACDPLVGCTGVPVADGTPCGMVDCVRAPICLLGVCVVRAPPHTPACTNWEQEGYLKALNTGVGDALGRAVSVSADGNTMAVSAWLEDSVDAASPQDDSMLESGAVYVFHRQGVVWAPEAYLKATVTGTSDRFGGAIALSGNGSTLVVGADQEDSVATGINGNPLSNAAPQSGAAYVFVKQGGVWAQQAYLKASNTQAGDVFGTAVAVSSDGTLVAVGAPGESSRATGVGGPQSDNSLLHSGAVYVFSRSAGVWTQTAYVKASNTGAGDAFGAAVALSADGSTLISGAPLEDSAATQIDGDGADDTAPQAGAVYTYRLTTGGWAWQAYLKAAVGAGARLGAAVSVSSDGNTLVVGAPSEQTTGVAAGAAHLFASSAGAWSELPPLIASNAGAGDGFGASVAISADGTVVAVGAPGEDSAGAESDNSLTDSGAAYAFAASASGWSQARYLKASNHDALDQFGGAVSLSRDGSTLGVGAVGESSAATVVDGDQTNNAATSAGAAYVF